MGIGKNHAGLPVLEPWPVWPPKQIPNRAASSLGLKPANHVDLSVALLDIATVGFVGFPSLVTPDRALNVVRMLDFLLDFAPCPTYVRIRGGIENSERPVECA